MTESYMIESFVFKACNCINFDEFIHRDIRSEFTSGVFDGAMFLFKHPIIFLYNCLIIFATMCLALMFRKRGFAFLILCTVWGILGTVNGVILLKRMTPFTLYDLQNTKDGFSLLTTYYSKGADNSRGCDYWCCAAHSRTLLHKLL